MPVFAVVEPLFPVVPGRDTAETWRQRDRFLQRPAARWRARVDARTWQAAAMLMACAAIATSLLACLGGFRPPETLVRVAIFALMSALPASRRLAVDEPSTASPSPGRDEA